MTIHSMIKNIKASLKRLGDSLRVAPKKILDKEPIQSDLEDYDSGLMIGETQETTEDSEKPTIDSSTYIRSHTTQRD